MKTIRAACLLTITLIISQLTPVLSAQENPVGIEAAITTIATEIATSMADRGNQKIAILPFVNNSGQITVLGHYLSESLLTDLSMKGSFQIYERSLLPQLIDELDLSATGLLDPTTVKEFGKMTGVDALITGTIAEFTGFVGVNCRTIGTETGEVLSAARVHLQKDKDVSNSLNQLITTHRSQKRGKGGGSPPMPPIGRTINMLSNGTYYVDTKVVEKKTTRDYVLRIEVLSLELNDNTLSLNIRFSVTPSDGHTIDEHVSDLEKDIYISDSFARRSPCLSIHGSHTWIPGKESNIRFSSNWRRGFRFEFPSSGVTAQKFVFQRPDQSSTEGLNFHFGSNTIPFTIAERVQ